MTMKRDITVAHATVELLTSIWPRCFSIPFAGRRPLKIRISENIAAAAEGAITPEELSAALRLYTGAKPYLKKLREGAARIDLDGNPAGIVTPEQAAYAKLRIERIEARASARTRAQGLAIAKAALEAKAKAEAEKEANRAEEVRAGKRKPLLRLSRAAAASAAA